MNLKKKILIFIIFLISSFVGLASLTVSVSPSKTTFGVNDEIIYTFYVQANAENFTNGSIKLVVPAEVTSVQCVQDPRMGACSLVQGNNTGGQTRDNYITVPIKSPILAGQFIQLSVIAKLATSGNNDYYNFTGLSTTSSPILTTKERTVTGDPITIGPASYKDTTGKVSKDTGDSNGGLSGVGGEGYNTSKVPGEVYHYRLYLDPAEVATGTFLKNVVLTDQLPPEVDYVSGAGGVVYDPATHTVKCTVSETVSNATFASCYFYVKVKETTAVGTVIKNNLAGTWESGDTGLVMTATPIVHNTPVIGDAVGVSKSASKSTYAPGEAITYTVAGGVNKNNTEPIRITDTLANTHMQIKNVTVTLQRTNNYVSTETATIKLYKNDGTVEYKTVALTASGRTFSATIDLATDFPTGSSDQITKWELVTSDLAKDDYQFSVTTSGIVLNTDRNGVAVVDGQILKNDVSITNNGKTATATTSPVVRVIYNQISINGTNDQYEYAGDLASKVPVTGYNSIGTSWRIVLATDADVTLTSNISTTNPFNQVVRSFNGGIPAEFANKSYEVKLYKNGSTVPYKTLTGTTVASGVNQVWFDESATFTGTTDLLTRYEVTIKDIKAYSKTQGDYRVLGLHETNNILEEGPNGEKPVVGEGVWGGTSIPSTSLQVGHNAALSTGQSSGRTGYSYLRRANEDRITQSASGVYNSGVEIPLTLSIIGYTNKNANAHDDSDQLPTYVDPNSKYYRKENTVVGILLPTQFEYSRTTSVPTTGTCAYNAAEVINNYNGTGRQLVRFTQVDPTCSNNTDIQPSAAKANTAPNSSTFSKNFVIAVKAKAGTLEGTYNFLDKDTFVSTDVEDPRYNQIPYMIYAAKTTTDNKGLTDTDDLDGDGLSTDQIRIANTTSVRILETARLNVKKYVRREGNTNWIEAPNLENMSIYDSKIEYKLVIENVGNLALKDIRVMDVLPYSGDTYITNPTLARGSDWTPNLLDALEVVQNTSGVTPQIYYNTSSAPDINVLNANNPITSDWTNNYSTSRSFLIDLPGATLQPAGIVELTFEGFKVSSGSLAINNQAWNSLATWYTVINKDGSTIKPGAPSEPEKVGIRAVLPTYIGGITWYDVNKDGIQDANEPGINGVKVEVIEVATGNAPYATTTANDPTTGLPGSFKVETLFMTSINYRLKFTFPNGSYVISPANQGSDDTKDSDTTTGIGSYIGTFDKTFTMGKDDYTIGVGAYLPSGSKISKAVVETATTGTTVNGIAEAGETLTYTLTITNETSTVSSDVLIKDSIASIATTDYAKYGIESIVVNSVSVAATGDLLTTNGLTLTSVPAKSSATVVYTVKMLNSFTSELAKTELKNIATTDGTAPTDCAYGDLECATTTTPINKRIVGRKVLTGESKTVNSVGELGEELTYTITLDNSTGTTNIVNIPIKDSLLLSLPTGITLSSAPVASAGTLTTNTQGNYTLNTIAAGQIVTVIYKLQVTSDATEYKSLGDNVVNVVTTDGRTPVVPTDPTDPCVGEKSCVFVPTHRPLTGTKALTAESITTNNVAEKGELLTYTITLDNTTGSGDSVSLSVKDSLLASLPTGITLSSAPVASTGTLTTNAVGDYTLDKVAKGTLTTITYKLQVTSDAAEYKALGSNVVNAVTTDGSTPVVPTDPTDPKTPCVVAKACTVTPTNPAVTSVKSLITESIKTDGLAQRAETLTYQVVLTNSSATNDAVNVTFKDSLLTTIPAGVTVSEPTVSSGTITKVSTGVYTVDKISKGSTATVTYTVTLPKSSTEFKALGKYLINVVTSDGTDPVQPTDPTNPNEPCVLDKTCLVIPIKPESGQLTITKSASKSEVKVGDILGYTVTAINNSDSDVENAIIADMMPLGIVMIDGSSTYTLYTSNGTVKEKGSITPTKNGSLMMYPFALIQPGEKVVIKYSTRIGAGVTVGGKYTNYAIGVTPTDDDPKTGDPFIDEIVNKIEATKSEQEKVISNTGTATVYVVEDKDFDNIPVIGKVFHDRDGDGYQDEAIARGVKVTLSGDNKNPVTIDTLGRTLVIKDITKPIYVGKIEGITTTSELSGEGNKVVLRRMVDPNNIGDITITTSEGTNVTLKSDGTTVSNNKGKVLKGDSNQDIAISRKVLSNQEMEVDVETVKETKVISNIVSPVHFDSGKSEIKADYLAKLDETLKSLKGKENVRIVAVGYTDSQKLSSTSKYRNNNELSEDRARQVADYLAKELNLSPDSIETEGRGESNPVVPNVPGYGEATRANRRTEIEIRYDEVVENKVATQKVKVKGYMEEITIKNLGLQEEGIPGVRLITPEGQIIETDQYGRYHIPRVENIGEKGRNVIVKVDSITLPKGSVFTTENPRVKWVTPYLINDFNFGVQFKEDGGAK